MLKSAFNRARVQPSLIDPFWLMVWAVAIDDDRQRREKERRRKREAFARAQQHKASAPRPF